MASMCSGDVGRVHVEPVAEEPVGAHAGRSANERGDLERVGHELAVDDHVLGDLHHHPSAHHPVEGVGLDLRRRIGEHTGLIVAQVQDGDAVVAAALLDRLGDGVALRTDVLGHEARVVPAPVVEQLCRRDGVVRGRWR